MKYNFIFFLIFCWINLSAQDSTYYKYDKLIKKANIQNESGEFEKAIEIYDEAFKLIDFIPYHYYDAFALSIADSNYLKANEYLIKGTLKGFDLTSWNSPEIELYNKSKFGSEYWKIRDSLLEIHFKSIDIEYYNTLKEMKKIDQSNIRRKGNKEMVNIDSLNFEKLILLSSMKGFPTFQKTGYGCNIAKLILWHNNKVYPSSNQWKRIIPLMNKEIFNGRFEPNFFHEFENKLKEMNH
ncbi:MAG: hypothetical protein HXX09_08720 [Bacteroidetes bacterium]|nr:hypothetical protein [Bacteroidota bacterium]